MIFCKNENDDIPVLQIYDVIGETRNEDGSISGISGKEFAEYLSSIEKQNKKGIEIHINSLGGSIVDGMTIYSAIKSCSIPVDTVCVGIAVSMAGVILQAGRCRKMVSWGYVHNLSDRGGETNKGITWNVWVSYFGDTKASHNRFLVMDQADWSQIFKTGYWDKCLAEQINDQRIANTIADWVWSSGQHFPELDTQKLINTIFNKHLAEDGVFGAATIEALNSVDADALYESLIERRKQYYHDIVSFAQAKGDHSQDIFLNGWINRVNNLVTYNKKLS
jgi:lysozyme family protein